MADSPNEKNTTVVTTLTSNVTTVCDTDENTGSKIRTGSSSTTLTKTSTSNEKDEESELNKKLLDIDTTITSTPSVDVISNINTGEFTSNVFINPREYTVSGDGIFDALMETATKHLVAQFEANRIRLEDYAVAYNQIYPQVLQTAQQIWLQKPQSQASVVLTQAQAELAKAQAIEAVNKAKYIIPLVEAQLAHSKAQAEQTKNQAELFYAQIGKLAEEIKLTAAQVCSEEKKIALLDAQIEQTRAQTAQINAQTELYKAQVATEKVKAANIESETNKNIETTKQLKYQTEHMLPAQVALVTAQATTEAAKAAHTNVQTALVTEQVNTQECQTKLVCTQADEEIYKYTNILPQQLALLKAQVKTQDVQAASETAKEKLYYRQIEGFNENFKEKMLKIMLDAWTVGFSASSETFYSSEKAAKSIPLPMTASEINDVWASFVYPGTISNEETQTVISHSTNDKANAEFDLINKDYTPKTEATETVTP